MPVSHPRILGLRVRCRRCSGCCNHRQLEWVNRFKLESYNKKPPYLLTLTYSNEYLPKDLQEAKNNYKNFIKKLIHKFKNIRYFHAIEYGSKKGRIHHHALIWCEDIQKVGLFNQWKIIKETWNKGRVESSPVRSIAGLRYVSKYIIKNYDPTYRTYMNHLDMTFNEQTKDGRLFTWSNRPALGTSGIKQYEKHLIQSLQNGHIPRNRFNTVMFGKVTKMYIPNGTYKMLLKKHCSHSKDLKIKQEYAKWLEKISKKILPKA